MILAYDIELAIIKCDELAEVLGRIIDEGKEGEFPYLAPQIGTLMLTKSFLEMQRDKGVVNEPAKSSI